MLRKLSNVWMLIVDILNNQSGQITDDVGTAEAAPQPASSPSESTDALPTGTPPTGTPVQESFIDPSSLPEEIKPHWKRMHRAYTKRLESLRDLETKKQEIDKFYSDPNFALEVIKKWTQHYGYDLTPRQQAQLAAAQTGQPSSTESQMEQIIKSSLDPSLHWLAPSLANALSVSTQQMLAQHLEPLQEAQHEQAYQWKSAEYDALAEDLTNIAPGWEEHEDEMVELATFLQSDALSHPKFGSQLQVLYNAVSGNAAATASVVKRMQGAVRNKGNEGKTVRSTPNLQETLRKAKNSREAWDILKRERLKGVEEGE